MPYPPHCISRISINPDRSALKAYDPMENGSNACVGIGSLLSMEILYRKRGEYSPTLLDNSHSGRYNGPHRIYPNTMPSEQHAPAWVTLTQRNYDSQAILSAEPGMFSYTSFRRSYYTAGIIERYATELFDGNEPFTCVIVGVGFHSGPIEQSYEPYLVDARLESLNIPHRLTLVDRDPRPLQAIASRRNIFLPTENGLFGGVAKNNASWEKFLLETSQDDAMTHEVIPELTFLPHVTPGIGTRFLGTQDYLDAGFRKTDVPASFVQGLDTGTVQLIHHDIVLSSPSLYETADFISCRNVLCHMPPAAQATALWNMSVDLAPGAKILINDFEDKNLRSMMEENGGWMSGDILQNDFSLSMEILSREEAYQHKDILLTKI